MAYVFDPNLDEEQNRLKEQEANAASVAASAGLVGSGGAPSAGASPTGATGPTSSGSFTNLQRYVTENQPQAMGLAEKVAGGVRTMGEEAQAGVRQLESDFESRSAAGRVAPDAGVVEGAAADPRAVSGDPTRRAAFIRQRDAAYTGPGGLDEGDGYDTAAEKVRKAQERAGLADTEAGRMQLLEGVSKPGAGRGKLILDQLLLSGAPETQKTLSDASTPFAGLQDYLTGRTNVSRETAGAAGAEAAAAKGAVASRFTAPGGVVPDFERTLRDRLTRETTARDKQNALIDELGAAYDSDMVPSAAALASIGMTAEDFMAQMRASKNPTAERLPQQGDMPTWSGPTRNSDYREWLYGHPAAPPEVQFDRGDRWDAEPTLAGVTTEEEAARIAALEDLLGTKLDFLPQDQRAGAGKYARDATRLPSFSRYFT